ncbi:phage tail sheath C-terminal domain-containing protein, partial [Escherichia coli]|uniref:phage tail sheath C-terminal domain-containing protein n=1 Tax=Escherichia coli TaxID=562 RepID=UPI0023B91E91
EVYSGATTEKQAWEVFRPARLMCKRTPMLTEAFGIEVNASNMNRPEDGARFEPLIGTRFGPGQAIVTPAVIKGELLATYRQLERAGIVENYELFKQYLVVERDASDPNRLNT